MTINLRSKLKGLFSSSYVLGGSPCSGKSTLAERFSREYHLPYYKADKHMQRHLDQADPRSQPTMAAYSALSWDEIWSQSVEDQVADVFAYYAEQFPMILEDLLGYCDQGPIIMEGVAFLPELVSAWGVRSNQALFLIPSKGFQIDYYSQRLWIQPILNTCRDPDQAFTNWMERDHRVGLKISQQAESSDYQRIIVDGVRDIDAIYGDVVQHFQISTAGG